MLVFAYQTIMGDAYGFSVTVAERAETGGRSDSVKVCCAGWIQSVNATHSASISAGVLNSSFFLGRCFNCLAIVSSPSCECLTGPDLWEAHNRGRWGGWTDTNERIWWLGLKIDDMRPENPVDNVQIELFNGRLSDEFPERQ